MDLSISDLEVLWVSRFDYQSDWVLASHAHEDFYQMVYCIEGNAVFSIADREVPIQSPSLFFFRPGILHGIPYISSTGLKTLDTKFSIKKGGFSRACAVIPRVIQEPPKEIFVLMDKILTEGNTKSAFFREYCQISLGQLLIQLLRLSDVYGHSQNTKKTFFQEKELIGLSLRIFQFIQQHYAENIRSEDFEEALAYSYRHLSKTFQADMGITPVEFVEHYRAVKAQELLNYSEYEIKQICEIIGYADVHHFTRSFKKITGLPPAQWRKRVRSGVCEDIIIQPDFKNTLLIRQKSGGTP